MAAVVNSLLLERQAVGGLGGAKLSGCRAGEEVGSPVWMGQLPKLVYFRYSLAKRPRMQLVAGHPVDLRHLHARARKYQRDWRHSDGTTGCELTLSFFLTDYYSRSFIINSPFCIILSLHATLNLCTHTQTSYLHKLSIHINVQI